VIWIILYLYFSLSAACADQVSNLTRYEW
jgi:hypothetical protein